MSVGEISHAWGRVFFVRLYCGEVVLVGWWPSKDFWESGTSRVDIGYVRYGFPDDVGEVMRNHEVRDVGPEDVTGLGCCCPVGVLIVQRSVFVGGAAVVSFEFC